MEIKRNIFNSSAKMPSYNETISSAIFDRRDAGYVPTSIYGSGFPASSTSESDWGKMPSSVRHARCPRIGEQK